ncbi:MAG: hypothetical protein WAT43_10540 [Chitinophagales bacterium]
MYGNRNLNTAEFWEYDTRLGRRCNLDPKGFTSIRPYAVFVNNPIIFIDDNGDIIEYGGTFLFNVFARIHLTVLSILSPTSRDRINRLKSDPTIHHIYSINQSGEVTGGLLNRSKGDGSITVSVAGINRKNGIDDQSDQNGVGSDTYIFLDFSLQFRSFLRKVLPGSRLLHMTGHELFHAEVISLGEADYQTKNASGVLIAEVDAVYAENIINAEISIFDRKDSKFRDSWPVNDKNVPLYNEDFETFENEAKEYRKESKKSKQSYKEQQIHYKQTIDQIEN